MTGWHLHKKIKGPGAAGSSSKASTSVGLEWLESCANWAVRQALCGKSYRKFRATTNSKHRLPVTENLLEHGFTASQPNEKWVGDIMYLPVTEVWLYLAVVLDLFSRRIIGWSMSERVIASLPTTALEMAKRIRGSVAGVIYHSDRGVQQSHP